MLDRKQTLNIFKSNFVLLCLQINQTKLKRNLCWNVILRHETDWSQCNTVFFWKRLKYVLNLDPGFQTWGLRSRLCTLVYSDGLDPWSETKQSGSTSLDPRVKERRLDTTALIFFSRFFSTEGEPVTNQDHDLLHRVWPWEETVGVCVWESVSEIPPLSGFLLEGRQTAIETVVWHSRKRKSKRAAKRGGWRGGEVDCASVHPSSSFPEPGENKQNSKNTKEPREATLSVGGLLQTPTTTHQDNTCLCLQPLID